MVIVDDGDHDNDNGHDDDDGADGNWLPSVKRGRPLWRGSWGASANGGDGCHYNGGGDDHHDNDEDDNNGDGAHRKWEHHYDGDCEVLTVIVIATPVYIVSIFLFHH